MRSLTNLDRRRLLDLPLAILSIGGMLSSVCLDLPVRATANAASDAKTLYASVWCFAHGIDAYTTQNISQVFSAEHIVRPAQWFGHAAVYPPTTLALLAPLTLVPMTIAVWFIILLSAVALVFALASLLRYATDVFDLSVGWKVALVVLCAGGPLIAFGLGVGNLSVLASALAIISFVNSRGENTWTSATALALGILLKPHLTIWIVVALLLCGHRMRRAFAIRAVALASFFAMFVIFAMAVNGTLRLQVDAFLQMLDMETSLGGSMNASSREALPIVAHITSLQSLIGFWTTNNRLITISSVLVLGAVAIVLASTTRRIKSEEGASLAVGAWLAFGMLATYHRAHDGIALLVLLPYLLNKVRKQPQHWMTWVAAASYAAMSFGPPADSVTRYAASPSTSSAMRFILLRQAGLAEICLLTAVLFMLREEKGRSLRAIPAGGFKRSEPAVDFRIAARSRLRNRASSVYPKSHTFFERAGDAIVPSSYGDTVEFI